MSRVPFPFTAIVSQDELKLALTVCAVDPGIGGVLAFGDRGTGKSTAVRALAALLPPMRVTEGCRYGCDPEARGAWCSECVTRLGGKSRAPKTASSARSIWSVPCRKASKPSSPACWRAPTAAFCMSMKSTC
jgi:Mg-chelatase subunit ChlI